MPDPLASDQSPVIAFGLFALATGLKAKLGRLRLSDRLALAERALAWCHSDDDVCEAASRFLAACYEPENVAAAGAELLDFLSTWMDALGMDALGIEATEEILRHADTVKPDAMHRARREVAAELVSSADPDQGADEGAAFEAASLAASKAADAAADAAKHQPQYHWQKQKGAGFDFEG